METHGLLVSLRRLEYTIEDKEVHILSPGQDGVVEPTVSHHVRPLGKVSFFVEFYKWL